MSVAARAGQLSVIGVIAFALVLIVSNALAKRRRHRSPVERYRESHQS
jgi:hypothetical protein